MLDMDDLEALEANIRRGTRLACVASDLQSLSGEKGCHLRIIDEKHIVDGVDDDDEYDQENLINGESGKNNLGSFDEKSIVELDTSCTGTSKSARLERLKREFLSISFNVNRDPARFGAGRRQAERQLQSSQDKLPFDESFYSKDPDEGWHFIHKRYQNLGNFETLLAGNAHEGKGSAPQYESIDTNDQVFKRTIVPGLGPQVRYDSLVVYNCALWAEGSKEPFDSTWLRQNAIISDFNKDSILPGIFLLLTTMKQGEWCEALIKPTAAFGKLGAPPRIPANATVFCLLEVVKVVDDDKFIALARSQASDSCNKVQFEEYYSVSDEARKRGNYYYAKDQFRVALNRYRSGIRILEGVTYQSRGEEVRGNELLVKLYNDAARAANKLGLPRYALSFCKQSLPINPNEPKTYWIKMNAFKKLGQYQRAFFIGENAVKRFANSTIAPIFQREVSELVDKMKKDDEDSLKLHLLMGRALVS